MSRTHFDYIVIGGGSGGYAAARTARASTPRRAHSSPLACRPEAEAAGSVAAAAAAAWQQ